MQQLYLQDLDAFLEAYQAWEAEETANSGLHLQAKANQHNACSKRSDCKLISKRLQHGGAWQNIQDNMSSLLRGQVTMAGRDAAKWLLAAKLHSTALHY